MDRRDFIQIGIAGSGGLLLTIPFSCQPKEIVKEKGILHVLNAYLSISTTGQVEIINPVPEIGQGVFTALPMLVAEELEVDWTDVVVRQADASEDYQGRDQRAAGSYSIRAFWNPMRKAGAIARELLVMAAADTMGTTAENCYAKEGVVYNRQDGSKLTYGELVAKAATYEAPVDIPLKDKSDFRLIGKAQKSKSIEEVISGKTQFGHDIRLDNMHYASIEKHPVYGATVISFNEEEVLSIPEVKWAFKIPYHGSNAERPYCREGIVVVATSVWGVLKGRRALKIEWDLGPNRAEGTEKLHKTCEDLVNKRGVFTVKNDGDIYGVLSTSGKVLEATYHVPFIAHIPMETVNCTVDLREDTCEIWSTTQMPNVELNFLANFLQMPPENINIHIPRIGGGFGRRLSVDFTLEAVKIAQKIKSPVQLFWTREDDVQFDSNRPFSYHRMMAALDQQGMLVGWLHRQSGTSRYAFREGREPHESEFFPNHFPAHLVPHFRQEYSLAESNLPRSLIRAPGNNALAFPVESFMDELAYYADRDPLEYRLELLGDKNQDFVFDEEEDTVISTERMKLVLKKAAKEAGWGKSLPKGRGMGMRLILLSTPM